ncbi:Inosine triphosphate pyrophosphatase [Smittium mucronatum]|uniref:Inosine triphosphate pyrophosphatase n=1 Tax=Smittium mucronatum TaxID=133383 RepID=A0A1R0GVE7_9FUNG|nr:Inosine triphosphate pyrophosphatase [Smittium mucronatum]OLY80886.1 Inosine triphosphate pyrophosphatase [Smittium mucronatum]
MEITFVTGNKNKLKEVAKILGSNSSIVLKSRDIDLPEIQGSSEEISKHKCKQAAEMVKGPVIIEDTSLCYNAFNGLPGPYVKWFLKEMGPAGLAKMLDGFEDKSGYAMCTFSYSPGPGNEPVQFNGITNGSIVAPRGPTTFGWDPIFKPDGFDETYAEMTAETKNSISHRYRALVLLQEYLITLKE